MVERQIEALKNEIIQDRRYLHEMKTKGVLLSRQEGLQRRHERNMLLLVELLEIYFKEKGKEL